MSNGTGADSKNNSIRRCVDCGSQYTYLAKTKNGTPYPHWYYHPFIEGAMRCAKCERNRSYHNDLPTKEDSKEIRKKRRDKRVCDECRKATCDIQLPWHHHPDKPGVWLCATCYQRRYYAPKKKFKTRKEQYEYVSRLFSGEGNPMYGDHTTNLGRTYTDERNKKVSEAVKKWAAKNPDHYSRIGIKGALKVRMMGLRGLPTGPEKIMENALKKHKIHYIAQYDFDIGVMDFYIPDGNIALFVDGVIWHADPRKYKADDILFFGNKISKNKWTKKTAAEIWKKDEIHIKYLKSKGYTLFRFWETEIREDINKCIKKLLNHIQRNNTRSE
jgi:DNA mismatch endonuclease, patch repair protein